MLRSACGQTGGVLTKEKSKPKKNREQEKEGQGKEGVGGCPNRLQQVGALGKVGWVWVEKQSFLRLLAAFFCLRLIHVGEDLAG